MLSIHCDVGDQDVIIRPLEQTEANFNAVLEVYRLCEDFLALGPVPHASMEILADFEHPARKAVPFAASSPPQARCLASSISLQAVLRETPGWPSYPC